jgi:hypothetical protein
VKGTDERPAKVYGIKLKRYYGEMRFPDTGLRNVVYIGVYDPDSKAFHPRGTGFLVQHVREGRPIYYLVTAHHVIRRLPNPNKFAVRMNHADGRARILHSPPWLKWWRHPTDKSVDAVVTGWGLRDYPYKLFHTARFLTPQNLVRTMIGVGDEVYIVGMFRKAAGVNQITPMVRTGHLAMMATERIPTANYGAAFMHLIEAFSLAGFSGSPVFVHETVSVPMEQEEPEDARWLDGVGNLYLLGLLHGIMPVKVTEELASRVEPLDPDQMWHSGISMVVPSTQILDIIDQPKLVAYERRMEKKLRDKETPVESTIIEDEPTQLTTPTRGKPLTIPIPTEREVLHVFKRVSRKRKKK